MIDSGLVRPDKIVIINRLKYEDRIVGGKIYLLDSSSSAKIWETTFKDSNEIYVFDIKS